MSNSAEPAEPADAAAPGPQGVEPTAVLADDEAPLLAQMEELLRRLWPELRVVGRADNGIDAIRLVETLRPTVAFLDIQMPEIDGLQAASRIGGHTAVVFVTAHDEHAVAAFERDAVDYVLKPVTSARLYDTVLRIQRRLAGPATDSPTAAASRAGEPAAGISPPAGPMRWITVSDGDDLRLLTADEIVYFEADNKIVRVITGSGHFAVRRALRELASELDPAQFWQVHRGYIVNCAFLVGLTRDFRGKLRLRLRDRPDTVPVSDTFAERLREL
jgi:DNA-binding LytR/AlgR family response regulator